MEESCDEERIENKIFTRLGAKIGRTILLSTLLMAISVFQACVGSAIWRRIESPNKTYLVELAHDKSRNILPLSERTVQFNLFKNGNPAIVGADLTTFNLEDRGFDSQYGDHKWVNETALRFHARSAALDNDPDSVVVSNHTNQSVKYLIINALDLFLVLDLQAKSSLELNVPRYKWQSWISAKGEFADGKAIQAKGVNFLHKDELLVPLRYCVSIENDGLGIQSPVIEGWNFDQPNTPRVTGCDR